MLSILEHILGIAFLFTPISIVLFLVLKYSSKGNVSINQSIIAIDNNKANHRNSFLGYSCETDRGEYDSSGQLELLGRTTITSIKEGMTLVDDKGRLYEITEVDTGGDYTNNTDILIIVKCANFDHFYFWDVIKKNKFIVLSLVEKTN